MKLALTTVALFALFNVNTSSAFRPKCGNVLLNKSKSNGKAGSTLEGQWPWQVALYQRQPAEDGPLQYICGGTLVSSCHFITVAHCITRKQSSKLVDRESLMVLLGKKNIKNFGEKVQVSAVKEIHVHPEYNATTVNQNLAILELQDPVTFSDRVQPACVWSDSDIELESIVGQTGSVPGWDYNDTSGELKLLEMPVVSQETCIRSYSEFFVRFTSNSTYCAGSRDSKDCLTGISGAGMFFEKDGSWYLRGVISVMVAKPNEYSCDPQHYAIFADVAQSLPWVKENVKLI